MMSVISILIYQTNKQKYMTWRDFRWWLYGVFLGAFPAVVLIIQR
jgi:hypothetical protein